jgi:glutamate---cysteine ligase / carboxylate-amine ligase
MEPEHMTLGVEEEFFIVDLTTGDLAGRSDELVSAAAPALGEAVTHELNRCQIEVATPVCHTLDDVRDALTRMRTALGTAAAPLGCGIAAVGTHPFASWEDQEIRDDVDRYRRIEHRYQAVARQQVICGCHVHVGVEDQELAVQIANRAPAWLPALLALSANSPYWHGVDTGFDSYRTEVWERWPTAGMPPQLASRLEYDDLVAELQMIGAIEDATHLYWYVRPSQRWPTVEFRPCDVCTDVEDAVLVAALTRALTWTCRRDAAEGRIDLSRGRDSSEAAMWRAARYGLAGSLVDPRVDRLEPASSVVAQLVDHVHDGLEVHGDTEFVRERVAEVLGRGNGATLQRRHREGSGEGETGMAEMVRSVVARTECSTDGPLSAAAATA